MRSRKTIATPPGATIREQLSDRGMLQKEFARRMDMSEKHISRLINGEVKLTPDVALRLELVLGIPAQFWNNLEAIYQEKLARVEAENAMDADQETSKKFPYNVMSKNGWVNETRKPEERVYNLRRFFGVANLGVLDDLVIPGIAYRRLAVREESDYALAAWAQKARIDAREITTQPINIERLKASLSTIRDMTMKKPDNFCTELRRLLSECGIALVFLPHIGGSFLHGASFYDGGKIVMGLTVRGRDADRFWFSLFHELNHVIDGHIGKPNGATIEDEQTSDEFAKNMLIPPDDYSVFVHAGIFTESAIVSFSRYIRIDPGIVVGRLQKDGHIEYSWHNGLKTSYVIR